MLDVVYKLNKILPLKTRQNTLDERYKKIHQYILRNFSLAARPPSKEQLHSRFSSYIGDAGIAKVLQILEKKDLILLQDTNIVAAYPFSMLETAHKIYLNKMQCYAVCAFDAVAISPVFKVPTTIVSSCPITAEKIKIGMDAQSVVSCSLKDIVVAIHWRAIQGCAAHSLCQGMVFLRDKVAAKQWSESLGPVDILSLEQAVQSATNYFAPLMD